jgi:hypothetical protein
MVRKLQVRLTTHEDADDDAAYLLLSPSERLDMMWPLALNAWSFALAGAASGATKPLDAESRLPRHIVSIQRRED